MKPQKPVRHYEAYQYIQCRLTEDKMREKEPGKI